MVALLSVGGSVPGESCAATCAILSVTNWRARQNSVSISNSTTTDESPCVVCDLILRTPGSPFMADSIGRVIMVSISSGAMASFSVTTVKTGIVMSG